MGNYVGSILFAQKALKLLHDAEAPTDSAAEQKLYLRLAKAYLHRQQLGEAMQRGVIERLWHHAGIRETLILAG